MALKKKTEETVAKVAKKAAKTVAAVKEVVSKVAAKTVAAKPAKKAAPVKAEKDADEKSAAPVAPAKKVATKTPKKAASKVEVSTTDAPVEAKAKVAEHSFNPEYLVLMQKDPNWMQAFWEVNERRVTQATKGGKKLVLRLYDVASDLTLRKRRQRQFRDFSVPANARSWYIQHSAPSTQYEVSLGTVTPAGQFTALVESSFVQASGAQEHSMPNPENLFVQASLGGVGPAGFGSSQLGMSSQMSFPWNWSSSLSGSSVSGESWNTAPAWAQDKGKDFFLWVKTRLIVYGGTRPDAHLQVRGENFPLNPDGTFSFEQDLPDSTQIIPVFATDKDGDFPTTIVPIVIKRTE